MRDLLKIISSICLCWERERFGAILRGVSLSMERAANSGCTERQLGGAGRPRGQNLVQPIVAAIALLSVCPQKPLRWPQGLQADLQAVQLGWNCCKKYGMSISLDLLNLSGEQRIKHLKKVEFNR